MIRAKFTYLLPHMCVATAMIMNINHEGNAFNYHGMSKREMQFVIQPSDAPTVTITMRKEEHDEKEQVFILIQKKNIKKGNADD